MQIQNITIVVRGTKGEVMKGVFDLEGNCISGSADIKDLISQQALDFANGADNPGDADSEDDSGLPNESGLNDETGDDAGTIDAGDE